MVTKRQPKIVYEWRWDGGDYRVYWTLDNGAGEIQCQSSQGSRDKTDAQRAVAAAAQNLCGDLLAIDATRPLMIREQGPGPKPRSTSQATRPGKTAGTR